MSEAILKFIGEKETKRSEMNKKSVYVTTVSKVQLTEEFLACAWAQAELEVWATGSQGEEKLLREVQLR